MDNEKNNKTESIRLQVFLAKAGIGSRRKCEEYIVEGRVKVNGQTITALGTKVTEEDFVTYNGRQIKPVKDLVYLALNKPPQFLCSNSDPEGRPLAVDLLKGAYQGRLYNVGRLDFLSSGLIFFTNDGAFTKEITHPSHQIEKEYVVETKEPVLEEYLREFKNGINIRGVLYKIKSYQFLNTSKIRLVLTEGKNREIRNFFLEKRLKVKSIHRVRIGPIHIGKLAPGEFRYLSKTEVASLLKGRGKGRHGNSN